tara:strand:- start:113 stop:454 length:342 start_codon:yes stop_codon:yes gene_type:complete
MANYTLDPEGDAKSFQESSRSTRSHFDSSSDSSQSIEPHSERTSLLYRHGPDYKSTAINSGEGESRYRDEAEDEDEEGEVLGEQLRGKSVFAIIALLMIGKSSFSILLFLHML